MLPARLNHPHFGIREVIDRFLKDFHGGDEIGVEYQDEFTPRFFQPFFESPGFVAVAIGPMDVMNVEAGGSPLGYRLRNDIDRLIRRVIKNLNLQAIAWVVNQTG